VVDRNISKLALLGFMWESGTKLLVQILSWSATIYVANLLNPSDYTYLLISGIYSAILVVISGMGVSSGIVVSSKITDGQVNNLFWFLIFTGLLAYLALYLLSPFIEGIYGLESLGDVLKLSGLLIITSNIGLVPYAVLLKGLRFKYIALVDMFSKLVLIGVSVLMAYNGFQYWSLVVSVVVSQAVSAMMFIAGARFIPKASFEFSSVVPLIRTSSRYLLVNISRYFNNNSVPFVISFVMNPVQVGIFQMAYTIATIPLLKVGEIFDHVTFPAVSALKGDVSRAKKMYLNLHKGLMGLAMPMYAGLFMISDDLVNVVLDDKWYDLIPILKILCIINLLRMSLQLVPRVVEGLGRPGISIIILLVMTLLMPLGIIIGANWGYMGSFIGWLLIMPFIFIFAVHSINRAVGSGYVEVAHSVLPPALSTTVMCAALVAASFVSIPDVWLGGGLFIKILLGMLSYMLTYVAFFKKDFVQLKRLYSA